MSYRRITPTHLIVGLLTCVCAILSVRVFAQEPGPRAPVSSAFTFQGRAAVDGIPVDGTCDFRFGLFDAATGGTQVGLLLERPAILVTAGQFAVQLDFGLSAFNGQARFVAIELRCPSGSGQYTLLPGRQELTATPYALYAQQVPWSGIVGAPPGFGEGWENVIVVAKSGGQFTSIQAAINSISGASDANRFLVWVAPGVYEERITIPAYVTVRGAGKELTIIRVLGGGTLPNSTGVTMAEHSALESIRVEITGSASETRAIQAQGVAISTSRIRVDDVSAWCGATGLCVGLYVANTNLSVKALDVQVVAEPPSPTSGSAFGISASAAALTLADYTIDVSRSSPGREAYGIYALNGSSYQADRGMISTSSSATAYGIAHLSGGEGFLSQLRLTAQSSGAALGIVTIASSAYSVRDSSISTNGQSLSTGIGISGGAISLGGVDIQPGSTAVTSTGLSIAAPTSQIELLRVTIGGEGQRRPSRAIYASNTGDMDVIVEDSLLWGIRSIIASSTDQRFRIFDSLVSQPLGGDFTCFGSYTDDFVTLDYDCYP